MAHRLDPNATPKLLSAVLGSVLRDACQPILGDTCPSSPTGASAILSKVRKINSLAPDRVAASLHPTLKAVQNSQSACSSTL